MSVKIFLPSELFFTKADCDIFGEIHIADNNSVSYFVTAASKTLFKRGASSIDYEELRLLGSIEKARPMTNSANYRDVSLSFRYNLETPNIYLHALSIKSSKVTHANIFLYDVNKLLQLQCESIGGTRENMHTNFADCPEHYNDIQMLFGLLRRCKLHQRFRSSKSRSLAECLLYGLNLLLNVTNKLFLIVMECKPIAFVIKRTVFYDHYINWKRIKRSGKQNCNIILDRFLGILLMLFLLLYISHPGDFLIQATHSVISDVRALLHALKGSPIGLKLNVHLNNFLLDCFSYHIDLWAKFLNLIEPAVRQLFVPIALLGFMGLSFQLALLSDLITVLGLHAHCFYTYTAVLYKVEIRGLQVLWKVVLGKRRNLLNNRVESHNYMNRQLYLATIFFTSLLFLFPTILLYYAVFTTLRLGIFLIDSILTVKRKKILEFPLQILLKWLSGQLFEIESLQFEHLKHEPPAWELQSNAVRMSLFRINVQSLSLGRVFSRERQVLTELSPTNEVISALDIIERILYGKF